MMQSAQWWEHGFGFMWLLPLLFLVIIMVFIRGLSGRGRFGFDMNEHTDSHSDTPMDILAERFAKGELSKTEYEDMKKALESLHHQSK